MADTNTTTNTTTRQTTTNIVTETKMGSPEPTPRSICPNAPVRVINRNPRQINNPNVVRELFPETPEDNSEDDDE